jgi:hypothetical protein
MKLIIYFLAIIPYLAFGQCDPAGNGTLSAYVQDHSVVLTNDTVYRNCGASYTMGISWLSSDTMIWIQTDTGGVAYCQCNYNLSLTLDSLSQGNYAVKVFYTHLIYNDTCYIGMVTFSITQPENFLTPEIINQWQSSCFIVGVEEKQDVLAGSPVIYPNPAGDRLFFRSDLTGESIVQISDVKGMLLRNYSMNLTLNSIEIENFKPGLYFVRIVSGDQISTMKFVKK